MALFLAGAMASAIAIALVLTWAVRELARRRGWMAGPASERHVHHVPIPRLGGVAVFITVATLVTIYGHNSRGTVFAALLPTGWMFIIGLLDDHFDIRARHKLAGQLAGGLVLFALGTRIPVGVPWFPPEVNLVLSFGLTVGWAVLVMNSVNLIDGLDGLAAGSSSVSLLALGAIAYASGSREIALLAVIAVGSLLGFLFFNWRPATIFLGDGGSLTIGSVVAFTSIRLMQRNSMVLVASVLILLHPLAETGLSIARRFVSGKQIFCPDRRHLHHRLIDLGFTHRGSTVVLVSITAIACLIGVLASLGLRPALFAVALTMVGMAFSIKALRYGEFVHFLRWLAKLPARRVAVGNQVRLDELRQELSRAASMTEIRIRLLSALTEIGFVDVKLRVTEYDTFDPPMRNGLMSATATAEFSLEDLRRSFGALQLKWSISEPPRIDLQRFAEEFIPDLAQIVARQLARYGERRRVSDSPFPVPTYFPAYSGKTVSPAASVYSS